MYAYLKGTVDDVLPDRTVIDCGGVGYEVFTSSNTQRQLTVGQTAKLYTYLHLAEGVMALYGFFDTEEREMFKKLISVSRIGPKLAMSVLSSMTPSDVSAAVVTDNAAAFDHVSGMGKKTAQRVILELKERVQEAALKGGASAAYGQAADDGNAMRAEAVAALVSLGYDGLSASRAVTAIETADSVETLLKQALKSLAKN